ncbi:hypothetical protein LQV63_16055 [Paenibacillus profundus]|uniref:DUF4306 domain-containing protein n=1 Tax=Paenibacillus profundus TaxID=1173085 RepID=A0ABS8YHV9_9BACL|nr:hypothetical protein [Paenibacillus profundus]MCE5170819.1 hypothetical protein [Paenibacillus profundus]
MIDNKISPKGILLILYLIVIIFVGVVFVPCYEVWGAEKNVHDVGYTFLFKTMDWSTVNGFKVYYEINYARLIYTIGIVTLIASIIWMLLLLWEKEDRRVSLTAESGEERRE